MKLMQRMKLVLPLIFTIVLFMHSVSMAAGTNIMYPKFRAWDDDGNPLAGGVLKTYEVGTTTPKTVYQDKDCSTPHESEITLDSNGEATIYICSGSYKLVLEDSDGNVLWTHEYYKLPINITSEYYLSEFDDIAAAATALNALGTDCTVISDETESMDEDVTLDAEVTFKGVSGENLTTTGYTMTYNGPVIACPDMFSGTGTIAFNNSFDSGNYRVFNGDMTVTFMQGQIINPAWFGDTGDALDKCHDSLPSGGIVDINGRSITYTSETTITNDDITWRNGTLSATTAIACFGLTDADNTTFEDISFSNSTVYASITNTSNFIRGVTTGSDNVKVLRCKFTGGYHAVRPIYGDTNWIVDDCKFYSQLTTGIMTEASGMIIQNSLFDDIGEDTADTTFNADGHAHHTHGVYWNVSANSRTIEDLTVEGCTFRDITGDAIHCTSGSDSAILKNINLRGNTYKRNANFVTTGAASSQRQDIQIGIASGADANSMVVGVNISNEKFMEAATTTGANWDLKGCIQFLGYVRGFHVSRCIAPNADYYTAVSFNGQSTTRTTAKGSISNNVFVLTVTDLVDEANKGVGIGRASYSPFDIVFSNNHLEGCNFGFSGNFTDCKFIGNTTKDIGYDNTSDLAHYYFSSGGLYNLFSDNNLITTTPASMSKNGFKFASGANYNRVKDNKFIDNDPSTTRYSDGGTGNNISELEETEVITTDAQTLSNYGTTHLDTTSGALAGTLPDGSFYSQIKIIRMTVDNGDYTLTVTHHETSDPEVFTFDDAGDVLVVRWLGTWTTVKNIGVAT